jgi:hypothetical protein
MAFIRLLVVSGKSAQAQNIASNFGHKSQGFKSGQFVSQPSTHNKANKLKNKNPAKACIF